MAQHYLLSSKSKNINLKDILRLTEEDAFHLLKTHRWGNPVVDRDWTVKVSFVSCKWERRVIEEIAWTKG